MKTLLRHLTLVYAGCFLSSQAAVSLLSTDFATTTPSGAPGTAFTLSSGIYSRTYNPGATSDMLVVGVSAEKSGQPFTVEFNGIEMNLAASSSTGSGASIYYLPNPAATGTISVDFSGVGTVNGFGLGIASLSGNGQPVGLDAADISTGSSTVALTTVGTDAFVMVAADANSTTGSASMDAPLTSIGTAVDVGSSQVGFGYEENVSPGSTTYTWSPQSNPRGMAAASFVTIPEPAGVSLMALGGICALLLRRRN